MPLEVVELLHAQAHLPDNGAEDSDRNVSRMPRDGDGDVLFGQVVNRVSAGPDLPVAGALQFSGQFPIGDSDEPSGLSHK